MLNIFPERCNDRDVTSTRTLADVFKIKSTYSFSCRFIVDLLFHSYMSYLVFAQIEIFMKTAKNWNLDGNLSHVFRCCNRYFARLEQTFLLNYEDYESEHSASESEG